MKVILIENMPKLGGIGDVCEVADGYARNYLLPQGLAIVATDGALKQAENLRRQEARRQERVRSDALTLKTELEALTLTFQARVGATGRLYGSITSGDIAERIEELIDTEIDRRKIGLDNALKELGTFRVPIKLLPDVTAEVTVIVEGEEEKAPPEAAVEFVPEDIDEVHVQVEEPAAEIAVGMPEDFVPEDIDEVHV